MMPSLRDAVASVSENDASANLDGGFFARERAARQRHGRCPRRLDARSLRPRGDNTGTAIVSSLIVFLIQNAQHARGWSAWRSGAGARARGDTESRSSWRSLRESNPCLQGENLIS